MGEREGNALEIAQVVTVDLCGAALTDHSRDITQLKGL
jgi:hypothetical protein